MESTDSVVGPGSGSHYDNAYFEVSYIKAFTTAAPGATAGAALHTGFATGVRLNPCAPVICFLLFLSGLTVLKKFSN